MKRLLALLLLVAAALPAPGRALAAPDRFDPAAAPPTPPAALLAMPAPPPGPAPAQTSGQLCAQALVDPPVALAPASQPWREYRGERLFATDRTAPGSAGGSLAFVADRDGSPASGPDVDAAGQRFTFAANLAELYGTFSYLYAPGTAPEADELRVELFEASADGATLGARIAVALVLPRAALAEGAWQQDVYWEVVDSAAIVRMRALGRAAVVFTFSGAAPASPGAGSRIWLDDLEASPCVPAASLRGQVTRGGAGAGGALVALVATGAGGSSIVASARADASGLYEMPAVPAQPAGVAYRVWFLNRPAAPPRTAGSLGFWAGPAVPQLSAGATVTLGTMEVGDVPLQGPASYAEVVATDAAPATLSWGARQAPRPGERHQLCLYDPGRGDPATRLPAQVCGPVVDPGAEAQRRFSLAPGSFAATPALGFAYGRSYSWYVVVYAGDPRADPATPYGYSFGERAITLQPAPAPERPAPPALPPGDPGGGVAGADWTLLIYVAADNALGDPLRAPALGRPSGQLASLPALAAAHPSVNLLSSVDRYGPGGVELCAYPPGAPADCRQRPEADSADPQHLAAFIAYGRGRYPAARTALLVVAPGQAAGLLALDETAQGAPAMSLAGLERAYQAAGLAAAPLDLVIYQAPLLGTAEALRVTAPYARYMVASASQVWQLGPYRALVPLLAGPTRGDPAAVARGAVTAYTSTVAAVGGARASVWAAYDLGRAGALELALDTLAEAVDAALTSEATTTAPALAAARAAAQSYDASGNGLLDGLATGGDPVAAEEDALVDLRDLAGELQLAVGAPAYVQQAAAELAALFDDPAESPLIVSAARSGLGTAGAQLDLSRARGLAIFFPGGDRLGGQAALAESYLYAAPNEPPGDTLWADMLRTYLAGSVGAGPGGATEGSGGGAQLRPMPGGFVSTTLYLPVVGR